MIWLIGCKGMLGTEVSRQLFENKLSFVGTDIDVDITNIDALYSFATSKEEIITHIINCSAYTAVDKAESDVELATRLNEDGPRNIAKLAKNIGATMIHISTDYVFDGTGNTPRTEDMPIAPIGVYGVTKAAGEKAVQEELDNFYIFRTAWLYGWAGKNFVYTMIKAMNTHDSVKVVNDQKGTPTFAGTLADVIIRTIKRQLDNNGIPFGIYNCTDLGETTWFEFTKEIKKQAFELGLITNKDCIVNPCTTDEYPTAAKRPIYSVLSKEKIMDILHVNLNNWIINLHDFLDNDLFDFTMIK